MATVKPRKIKPYSGYNSKTPDHMCGDPQKLDLKA